jgi:hypothetical protein
LAVSYPWVIPISAKALTAFAISLMIVTA